MDRSARLFSRRVPSVANTLTEIRRYTPVHTPRVARLIFELLWLVLLWWGRVRERSIDAEAHAAGWCEIVIL